MRPSCGFLFSVEAGAHLEMGQQGWMEVGWMLGRHGKPPVHPVPDLAPVREGFDVNVGSPGFNRLAEGSVH